MNALAAHMTATWHVLGLRLQQRTERGQTTAEYVGIMVFIAVLIVALLALKTNVLKGAQGVVDEVFKKLKETVGGG